MDVHPKTELPGEKPDGWLVGLSVYRTEDEARANVRNPEVEPIPLFRPSGAEYDRGYADGHRAGYELCLHERT